MIIATKTTTANILAESPPWEPTNAIIMETINQKANTTMQNEHKEIQHSHPLKFLHSIHLLLFSIRTWIGALHISHGISYISSCKWVMTIAGWTPKSFDYLIREETHVLKHNSWARPTSPMQEQGNCTSCPVSSRQILHRSLLGGGERLESL
jgi:hypothetical protein